MARTKSAMAEPSCIGPGTRIEGRVTGGGDLRVEGTIVGDVRVDGSLTIERSGSVEGGVDAGGDATIGGRVKGDVAAQGDISILAGSQVEGDTAGASVSLEEGAGFSGRIDATFDLPEGMI